MTVFLLLPDESWQMPYLTLAFPAISPSDFDCLSFTCSFSNISRKSHQVRCKLKGDGAYLPESSIAFEGDFMTFADKSVDVLQNLESAIIPVYRERSELIDAEVLMAIESLIRVYSAQAQGKSISSRRPLRGLSQQVASSVQQMCEWRLGRVSLTDAEGNPLSETPTPKTQNEIVDCLKTIQSSLRFWTKERGRQGYLNFVSEFLP